MSLSCATIEDDDVERRPPALHPTPPSQLTRIAARAVPAGACLVYPPGSTHTLPGDLDTFVFAATNTHLDPLLMWECPCGNVHGRISMGKFGALESRLSPSCRPPMLATKIHLKAMPRRLKRLAAR
jgi:hypothetical protein